MKIAVIGGGISGNTCVWLLHRQHDVTLFEANDYVGGHTNTIDIQAYGRSLTIDTGFMVYNERTYPLFTRLLDELNIDSQDSDMSFSVSCERTGWEYQGSSLSGLFAQRRNLVRPAFYRLLAEISRFNRRATAVRNELDDQLPLGEFVRREGFHERLTTHYLLPMTAAIWSASPAQVRDMPARFLMQFFHNHGLLQIYDRPQWRTVTGGARRYVRALLAPLALHQLRLSSPVQRVQRTDNQVIVSTEGRGDERFDAVIFACHADQALAILADPTPQECSVLTHFPYQKNLAIVHTDSRFMPQRPAAWASWNYRVTGDESVPACVTYDLNRLQRLAAPGPVCVTLNPHQPIRDRSIVRRIHYQHPTFGPGTLAAQSQRHLISGHRNTYFCGAYWRYGFHEDGVWSAMQVADEIERHSAAHTLHV